jgi:hypothetical protein
MVVMEKYVYRIILSDGDTFIHAHPPPSLPFARNFTDKYRRQET